MPETFGREAQEGSCIDCGADLGIDADRAYATGPDSFLCFSCAARRGGVYDEDEDHWVEEPNLTGLPDERQPHP